jgi:hypothetical protein
MRYLFSTTLAVALAATTLASAGESPAAPGAKVFFVNLKDGAVVSSPVKVEFGVSGMEIVPAGTDKPLSGHHHILLDREPFGKGADGAEEANANILSDEKNIHFGKGQTETTLDLKPGKHTLQLVLGDKDHIPHTTPLVSDVITIEVK